MKNIAGLSLILKIQSGKKSFPVSLHSDTFAPRVTFFSSHIISIEFILFKICFTDRCAK